ncbi:MAG: YkgJ family cysteine cluster protein [Pseudomonadota bacterium]
MPRSLPPQPSPCLRCGRCCEALSLDFSKAQLREMAVREQRRLRREPGHSHAADMRRLVSDVAFIQKHFRRVSRQRAADINPTFSSREFDGRFFYICDALDSEGRCSRHAERPYLCEGYPWYRDHPRIDALVVYPCGYERDLVARRARVAVSG